VVVYEHWNTYGLYTTTYSQPKRGHIRAGTFDIAYPDVFVV